MTIYSFWVFDRHCNCIYNREWTQVMNPTTETAHPGSINSKDNEDTAKLLFGALFSLRNISKKLGSETNQLNSFATTNYRAHFFETASGLKLCALSDLKSQDLKRELQYVFERIYIDNVVRNPLSPVDFKPGKKITNPLFIRAIDRFFTTL